MTINQLMISKYLLQKGEETLRESNPISSGLAISLFLDAAEILVWTIAKEVDAQNKPQESFLKIWDLIKDAPKNHKKISLPLKNKIIDLNSARIGFKHYGILPAETEAVKFYGYTHEFLRESMKLFFDTEINDLSLADIINNLEVKKRIKLAESYLSEKEIKSCLINCGEAEYISSGQITSMFPRADKSLSEAGDLFEREKASSGRRVFKYISEYLNVLRDVCVVNLIGIQLPDYLRFKKIVPIVHQTGDGNFHSTFLFTKQSLEEARFCVGYVTKFALNVQDKTRLKTGI